MKTLAISISKRSIAENEGKNVQLRDIQIPALVFRYSTRHNGSGSFYCRHTKASISTSKVLGRYPGLTPAEARTAAMTWLSEKTKEKYQATRQNKFSNCGELLAWYIAYKGSQEQLKNATLRNIQSQVEMLKGLNEKALGSLNPGELAEQWLFPKQKEFQLSTLRGAFQCLKGALKQAAKLRYLHQNPLAEVTFSDLSSQPIRPRGSKVGRLPIKHVKKVVLSLPWRSRMLSLICLGYLTRNQETVYAKWSDFDLEQRIWRIPAEHTKTSQSLQHPITEPMAKLLVQYKRWQRSYARSQFLFPQKKGRKPISASSAAHIIAKDTKGQFRLHDLRKYGSSFLRDMGVD